MTVAPAPLAWPVGCNPATVLCSAEQCLGESVEEALVASLVSSHLMFVFGYFLVGIKCAGESSDRKGG